jgi:pyrophosphatase PpaX
MAPQRKPLQGVLFDWDGTLVDSYHADSSAYFAMFKEMGIDWGEKELARHYSPDWYAVYRAARLPRKQWAAADLAWRAHYAKHSPRLFVGVRRILSKLAAKHRLGLVTSGDRDRVHKQLRAFRLTSTFVARVCGGDTKRRKPHPEPLLMALRHMRLDPAACVYVGDSPQDIQMARRAGVRAIGVIGSFPTEAGLRAEKPEILLSSLNELPEVLKTF